jgi:hypothetical protein
VTRVDSGWNAGWHRETSCWDGIGPVGPRQSGQEGRQATCEEGKSRAGSEPRAQLGQQRKIRVCWGLASKPTWEEETKE